MILIVGIIKRVVLLFSLILPLFVIAQISPGDLSEAHAHLEGLSNCTQCHVLNKNVSNEKCLNCHKVLSKQISEESGYHVSAEIKGKACVQCHSDHHGRKFQMIRFDTLSFEHVLAGYKLEGAHSKTTCSQCHRKSNITNADLKNRKQTYLGLQTDCLHCHDDYHMKTLAANCMNCHSFESFKQLPNFSHAATSFPLLGKHSEVSCEKCHPTVSQNNKDIKVFKGIKFDKCTDCHKDVHNNKFGPDCKKCHTEQSFHVIKSIQGFDHSKTGYKLEGKHLNVACKKCHPAKYTQPVAHQLCTDCHTDFHENQLMKNGKKPDCINCHTTRGFQPSIYSLESHQESVFPLEGAHLATPCFSCHRKESKWQFRKIGLRCADCHDDIHQPYLDKKYYPDQSCKSCHSMESWTSIGFDHEQTKYPLFDAHRKPSCRACHQSTSTSGEPILRFSGISNNCVNCHNDKHAGQFLVNGSVDCARCHESKNWKASLFDHNQSRFPLDGKHDKLSCSACHKPAIIGEITTIEYKLEDIRCESCH